MARLFVFLIRLYQFVISPYLGSNCRYTPTCSQYAIECYKRFNLYKATKYTVRRILSCHPKGGQGYDPVPKD